MRTPDDEGLAPTIERGSQVQTGLPPGTQVGRYVIKSFIARGGMGAVHAAHDPELDRDVAVKLVRVDKLDPGRGERRPLRPPAGAC